MPGQASSPELPTLHARTHRPKAQGGTDPIDTDAKFIAGRFNTTQVVTTTAELEWDFAFTNAPEIFKWDSADPAGLLVLEQGLFMFHAAVSYSAGLTTTRAMYQSLQPLSSGAGVFGSELGDGQGVIGTGGQGVADNISPRTAARLSHYVTMYQLIPTPGDPGRHTVVLQHDGSDYTVGNLGAAAYIVRLAGHGSVAATAP